MIRCEAGIRKSGFENQLYFLRRPY